MSFDDPTFAGDGTLVKSSARSPLYVAGVSGWSVNGDGSAEFNDVTVRGQLLVSNANGSRVWIHNSGTGAAVNTTPPTSPDPTVDYLDGIIYSTAGAPGGLANNQCATVVETPHPQQNVSPFNIGAIARLAMISQSTVGDPSLILATADKTQVNGGFQVSGFTNLQDVSINGTWFDTSNYYDSGVADQGLFIGTAFNDVVGLVSIPVAANSVYTYELHVAYTATAGGGAKFAWNPVGGVISIDRSNFGEPTTSSTPTDTNVFLGRKAAGTTVPVGGGAAVGYHEFGRIVNTGAAGAITFRTGENVASTGMTVHARSWFQRRRIS